MKHNYFSVMPRAARLLLVVVLALVMPAQTWAKDVRMFMSDLMLVGGADWSTVSAQINYYQERGYKVIDYDLNKGCGNGTDYIYLLYKPADWNDGQNHGYITDLAIKTSTDYPDSFYDYETEMTYYLVPYAGGSRFTGTKGNLNSGTRGTLLHLYYSKDDYPGSHIGITQIYFDSSSTGALSSDGAAVDLNKGAGGAYIYLHYNKDLYTHIRPGIRYDLSTYSSPDHTLYLANEDWAYGTLATPTDIVILEGANVGFHDACINEGMLNSGRNVICAGDATITIQGFCSIFGGGPNDPAIRVLPDHKLTLTANPGFEAVLYAYSGIDEFGVGRAAGIGAGYMSNCGDIEILRGDVQAVGGQGAAAIGGTENRSCGSIYIGPDITKVLATHSEDSPNAIGAGRYGFGGKFTYASSLNLDVSDTYWALMPIDPDGIEEMEEVRSKTEDVFDLQGRRINKTAQPGIYIRDGKKILVK
jgi:hypothetical protein